MSQEMRKTVQQIKVIISVRKTMVAWYLPNHGRYPIFFQNKQNRLINQKALGYTWPIVDTYMFVCIHDVSLHSWLPFFASLHFMHLTTIHLKPTTTMSQYCYEYYFWYPLQPMQWWCRQVPNHWNEVETCHSDSSSATPEPTACWQSRGSIWSTK